MFAYCKNNPVNNFDPDGFRNMSSSFEELKKEIEIITVVGAVVATAVINTRKAIGNAISSAVSNAISSIKTHGNSKESKIPQHGYEIYNKDTGDVVKVGISGGRVRLDGKSYRAEKQVRDFNSQDGGDIYASRIMEYFPDRQSALEWEWLDSQYRYAQGHSMTKHVLPARDNWWDIK